MEAGRHFAPEAVEHTRLDLHVAIDHLWNLLFALGLPQPIGDLIGGERLARAHGYRNQDAKLTPEHSLYRAIERQCLVIARRFTAHFSM